jgi:periplasmic divalent cation tolerance protein
LQRTEQTDKSLPEQPKASVNGQTNDITWPRWLGSWGQWPAGLGGHVAEAYCAVITTTDGAEAAGDLGRAIVEARLGACVQIVGPIRSIYRWEGGIQNDQEWQCWVKTSTDRVDVLTDYIKKNHSYDMPEVVVLPIVGGSDEYLSWVADETRPV